MNCFQNVKYGVSCREAAERYGVEVNHCGMALCPFHNDRHPSLYAADDHYYCFACGEHGDVIDFAAKAIRLAALRGGAAFGNRLSPHTGQTAQRSGAPRKSVSEQKHSSSEKNEWLCFSILSELCPCAAGLERYAVRCKSSEEAPDERFAEACHKAG